MPGGSYRERFFIGKVVEETPLADARQTADVINGRRCVAFRANRQQGRVEQLHLDIALQGGRLRLHTDSSDRTRRPA